ncbi:MAG: hypothetical protein HYR67_17260 [Bacteroidetes bacterium]|nr:hypothetical protein [Bacteroidota bacterium]
MEKDIQKRIEETLDANRYIKPVSPKPFFYTRVKARMEWKPSDSFIQLIPVSLRVVCFLILIINTAFFLSSSLRSGTENMSDQLASFYQFNSTSVYSNQ